MPFRNMALLFFPNMSYIFEHHTDRGDVITDEHFSGIGVMSVIQVLSFTIKNSLARLKIL